MSRNHIHLAPGHPGDDGVYSARVATAEIIIEIDLDKAIKGGIPFYISDNRVILTPGPIPTSFFSRVYDIKTGIDLLD